MLFSPINRMSHWVGYSHKRGYMARQRVITARSIDDTDLAYPISHSWTIIKEGITYGVRSGSAPTRIFAVTLKNEIQEKGA